MSDYQKARKNLIDMYIKSLEEGIIPLHQMWKTSVPINAISKVKYVTGENSKVLIQKLKIV